MHFFNGASGLIQMYQRTAYEVITYTNTIPDGHVASTYFPMTYFTLGVKFMVWHEKANEIYTY